MSNEDIYLQEMIDRQLNDCNKKFKLSKSDMKRIIKYTKKSIFSNCDCCLWTGYITFNKISYVNFYFNKKKFALHRLLYLNFVGDISENTYLTFSCKNKGICCNINHILIKKKNIIKKKNNNTVYFD